MPSIAEPDPLVVFVRSHPGMAETLLAQHRDDGTGHCTMCSDGGQRGRPIWPCTTAVAARAATTRRTDRPTR